MQAGVFEADGVIAAPAFEVAGLAEVQGLQTADASTGDLFAFHIKASRKALQTEPQLAALAAGMQCEHARDRR